MAELWFEEEEEMQDADIWEYDSEDEIMEGNQEEEEQQQQQADTDVQQTQMQQQAHGGTHSVCRKQLTLQQRRKIVDAILVKMNNGTLPRGHMKQLSSEFNVHKSTITRIFTAIKRQLALGDLIDVRTKKIGKTGRKPLQISDETLQSVLIRGFRSTNRNTPLTGHEDPTFVDMRNVIHCDEKWFYFNPDKRRFYLLPTEDDPYMAVQSRRFKLTAMFMTIIGKSLYGINGELLHDGKYGIFPFTVQIEAQKSSKKRPRGTMETKALQNINR
ncbi:uncharacterized protein LOC110707598 [Chenopodium quinoa]|uniref:uncharacterized protein LOC110707598 n=1 Tax=Chenopodium quinoa TaxID=63459 RepID=UPI000B79A658|nr:uncharacterized protein LOC110707598 [Chenopodium quinoa]